MHACGKDKAFPIDCVDSLNVPVHAYAALLEIMEEASTRPYMSELIWQALDTDEKLKAPTAEDREDCIMFMKSWICRESMSKKTSCLWCAARIVECSPSPTIADSSSGLGTLAGGFRERCLPWNMQQRTCNAQG